MQAIPDDRHAGKPLLYRLYNILGGLLVLMLEGVLPSIGFIRPEWKSALVQRLWKGAGAPETDSVALADTRGEHAVVPVSSRQSSRPVRIWLHAASVGEVGVAQALIGGLGSALTGCQFLVTTTTWQGHLVGRERLEETVRCQLAPFDASLVVRRLLGQFRPDLLVCVETELWPAMLIEARHRGVRLFLANGRMTARSCDRYRWCGSLLRYMLDGFTAAAVISSADQDRFATLGLPPSRIRVTGNLKYDFPAVDLQAHRARQRHRLGVTDQVVFICGSTRAGEESFLLPVYRRLRRQLQERLLWVIAPRHLGRLPAIQRLLEDQGLEYRLLSRDSKEVAPPVIVVDTMGELARLYAAGDYLFCGGSLVPKGGHNIMEAARWALPVFFGPHMADFQDAVELLTAAGGGFQVNDANTLADRIIQFNDDPAAYAAACRGAARAVATQRGAVQKQVDMILTSLAQEKTP